MTNITPAKHRRPRKLAAALALGLGLATATGHASQNTVEPQVTTRTPSASETLSAKQQTIPLIASFMAASDMHNLNAALNQGLDAGLTVSEAKEVLVQLYAYVGFPRSLNALGELMKVVEARKQRGIQDAPGREPSRVIPTGDALLAVGKANQTKISGAPVQGPLFDFTPVINQFLQAHLFGDIFERDNLDWQSRELATVGALAATPGAEAQLRSHMAASMRVGLTAAQLRQLTQVLAERAMRMRQACKHRADAGACCALGPLTMNPAKTLSTIVTMTMLAACATSLDGLGNSPAPLLIQKQGSFAAGGKVTTAPGTFDPRKPLEPAGQTYHGDHAYGFYQTPVNARRLPIVMLHGAGQSSKTWESTSDRREGFQNIFLRRRFGVVLID